VTKRQANPTIRRSFAQLFGTCAGHVAAARVIGTRASHRDMRVTHGVRDLRATGLSSNNIPNLVQHFQRVNAGVVPVGELDGIGIVADRLQLHDPQRSRFGQRKNRQ
jgi:hypothetical protein